MPSTWLGLVLFLLVVAPGLLFDLLSDKRRALVRESSFRELGRTILASVAFGSVGALSAVLAFKLFPSTFADPSRLIGRGAGAYANDAAVHLAASFVLQTIMALFAALVAHLLLLRRTTTRLRPVSSWHAVFREHPPKGTVPFVRIRTKSGTVWAGIVYEYSPNLEVGDRELVLGPPLASARNNVGLKALPSANHVTS